MASSAAPGVPSVEAQHDERSRYIETQLNRARRQVWLVELGVVSLTLLSGVLAYLLLWAVVDHWVWPLGNLARWFALAALLVGSGYFAYRRMVPLILHRINPLYAARTVERSNESLKNSLINFLFLRERPTAPPAVFEALKRTAARDLSTVSVESSVDRTQLIRILYVLTAAIAVTAFYKVASPKDPLQSVARVLMPWADRQAPSRVTIGEIQPGDTTALYDERVTVKAFVRGVRGEETVKLLYSTADEQEIDRTVEMSLDSSGLRYEASLPAGATGLRQDVTYRIEAGDARSRPFEIRMAAQPMIFVERLEFTFPAYTQRPPQVVQRQGNIEVLEGTRVKLHARANKPLRSARIEWNPAGTTSLNDKKPSPLEMQIAAQEATAEFSLSLTAADRRADRDSYQLRIVTEDGQENSEPLAHSIVILPDLAPVVELLTPRSRSTEVPLNGSQVFEVRAVDPDFGLAQVRLHGAMGPKNGAGREFSQTLLDDAGWRGQFVGRFEFQPERLGLAVGDVLTFRALAADNRHDAAGSPAGNEVRTDEYRITVIEPTAAPPRDAAEQPEGAAGDDAQPDPGAEGASRENAEPQDGAEDAQPEDDTGQQEQGQPEQGQEGSGEGVAGAGQQQGKQGQQQGDGQAGENSSGAGPQGEGPQQQNQQEQGQGADGPRGQGEQQGARPGSSPQQPGKNQNQSDRENAAGQSPETGGAAGQQENTGDEGGNTESGSSGEAGGSRRGGNQTNEPTGAGDDASARSPDDLHDGDVFEKVRRYLEKQKDNPNAAPPDASSTPTERQPGAEDSGARNAPSQDGRSDEGADSRADNRAQGEKPQDERATEGDPAGSPAGGEQGKQDNPAGRSSDQQAAGATKQPDQTGPKESGAGTQGKADDKEGGSPLRPPAPQDKTSDAKDNPPTQDSKPGVGENSQSGAGVNNNKPAGSGEAEKENRDRNKELEPDSKKPEENEEPSGLSSSKRQSDSKGDKFSGDQSGGGGQGAGQSAKQPGRDSGGSQQAADEGSGTAEQSGPGATSSGAGNKQQAEGQAGQPGEQPGEGSGQEKSPQGDKTGPNGAAAPEGAASEPAGEPPAEASEMSDTSGQREGTSARPTGGGGLPSNNRNPAPAGNDRPPPPPAEPDEANVEYARKATDLVLDYLKDQQQNPNQQLLDELGWTPEEMADFVKRWENLKKAAEADPTRRGDLDESLRSLGLRPPRDTVRRDDRPQDARRSDADDALRTAPPQKYFQQFNAFRKGVARAVEDDGQR